MVTITTHLAAPWFEWTAPAAYSVPIRIIQKASVAAPQSEEVRRPHLSDKKDAGTVETKITMPVTPDARNELSVLDRPAC